MSQQSQQPFQDSSKPQQSKRDAQGFDTQPLLSPSTIDPFASLHRPRLDRIELASLCVGKWDVEISQAVHENITLIEDYIRRIGQIKSIILDAKLNADGLEKALPYAAQVREQKWETLLGAFHQFWRIGILSAPYLAAVSGAACTSLLKINLWHGMFVGTVMVYAGMAAVSLVGLGVGLLRFSFWERSAEKEDAKIWQSDSSDAQARAFLVGLSGNYDLGSRTTRLEQQARKILDKETEIYEQHLQRCYGLWKENFNQVAIAPGQVIGKLASFNERLRSSRADAIQILHTMEERRVRNISLGNFPKLPPK